MESRNIEYVEKIDHLRFLAATLVFCFHYWQLFIASDRTTSVIREGYSGVTLFFVLSGFLFMKIALSTTEIRYPWFIFNRILRIFPLYLSIAVFVGLLINRNSLTALDIITLVLPMFGTHLMSKSPLTGVAWTIGVEFAFYLAFPFLAAFTKRLGPFFLIRLIFLIVVLRTVIFLNDSEPHLFYGSLVGRFDQFFIGMLTACALNRKTTKLYYLLRRPSSFAVSLILLYYMLFVQARQTSLFLTQVPLPALEVFWPLIESATFALVIATYVTMDWKPPRLFSEPLRFGGQISYSFYMIHYMLLFSSRALIDPNWLSNSSLASALNAILLFSVTAVVATLSYFSIERPFLTLRRQYVAMPELKQDGPLPSSIDLESSLSPSSRAGMTSRP